jgi:uncharacterized protein Yka (UPF0111/DUF47 family)
MSEESSTITATAISEFDRQIEASNDRREARIQQIEAVNRELKLLAEQKAALLEQAEQMWQRIAAEEERIDRAVSQLLSTLPSHEKSLPVSIVP